MPLWFHFIYGGEGRISLDFIRARSDLPVSDLWVWPKGMQLKNTLTQHPRVVKESQPALQTEASIFVLLVLKGLSVTNQLFHVLARFLKELASALKSALSGHLETVILGLLKTPAQYDASELKASMKVNMCKMQSLSNLPLIFVNYSFLSIIR